MKDPVGITRLLHVGLSLAKRLSGVHAFEISNIEKEEAEGRSSSYRLKRAVGEKTGKPKEAGHK